LSFCTEQKNQCSCNHFVCDVYHSGSLLFVPMSCWCCRSCLQHSDTDTKGRVWFWMCTSIIGQCSPISYYLAPMWLHCKNHQQLWVGTTFENQMMNFEALHNWILQWWREKIEANVGQNGWMKKFESTKNICQFTNKMKKGSDERLQVEKYRITCGKMTNTL
jgi:hypothetical protein